MPAPVADRQEAPVASQAPGSPDAAVVAGLEPRARYRARLSAADHHSTDGSVLRAAALVIRQDRYNYHVARRRDAEDEGDPLLGAKAKRAKLQGWLAGRISADVEQRILDGTPLVEVSIFPGQAEVRIIED